MSDTKVAVVTGGSRGIGRGIVLELASRGFSVVVNYQARADAAEETCEEALRLGAPSCQAIAADVSDFEASDRLVDQVLDRFHRIDTWVNNAGVAPRDRLDLLETTPQSWDRVLGINLRGPFFLTQKVARVMVEQVNRNPDSRPSIIFVTSVSSTFASTNRGEYCVSKAGLSMVVQLFATRLAEHGIGVHEVRPGIIATDMTAAVRDVYDRRLADGLAPMRRLGTPSDVGRAVALLATGELGYSTGTVLHVDGGLHIPRL